MNMLIVVDMLNDFLDQKGALYCGDLAGEIIPAIQQRLEEARRNGDMVIFLQDNHKQDDLEFKKFPPHCIAGTWGAEIIDELRPLPREVVMPKTRYSGFYNTNLGSVINFIDQVTVVGVCTSICVMDTVGEIVNRDIEVVIPRDCVADFDQVAHEFALKRMEKIYGAIII